MKVVFKITPDEPKQCIAFLLEGETSCGIHLVSYMHIGQHAEVYAGYYYACKPATPEQYKDLKEELESIGYELEVLKKSNAWKYAHEGFIRGWGLTFPLEYGKIK